jgi:hypothetical protein
VTLSTIAQDDFAAGIVRGTARDVQAGVGAHEILNGLISDDGDVFRRGGSKGFSSVAGPVHWLWTGTLNVYPNTGSATKQTAVLLGTPTGYSYAPLDGGAPTGLVTGSGSTVVGATYPMQAALVFDAVNNRDLLFLPNGMFYDPAPTVGGMKNWGLSYGIYPSPDGWPPTRRHVASVAGRLAWATGSTVYLSAAGAPVFIGQADDPDVNRDAHELSGGARIMGLASFGDTLMVFTDYGLWSITNLAYDLTDAAGNIQQSLSLIVPELGLWGEGGLAPWRGKLVAACRDAVYTLDNLNAPVPVSDSISEMYAAYVAAGARPGVAKVFRNTLFLPVLDAAGNHLDLLTCRLDRPVRERHVYYPWTRFSGHALRHRAFDVQGTQAAPRLLGGNSDGTVNDLTGVFSPSATSKADADGSVYPFALETRDFPLGQGLTHLKRLRLRYTSEGTGAAQISYSSDPLHAVWVTLPQRALSANGEEPLAWWLTRTERLRYVRVRLTTADPVDRLTVHRVELVTRPATHAR